MKIMTTVEIKWSTHEFLFKPATIPSKIPRGTEIKTEITLTLTETGNLSAIIVVVEILGFKTVDVPQSQSVTILFNHAAY